MNDKKLFCDKNWSKERWNYIDSIDFNVSAPRETKKSFYDAWIFIRIFFEGLTHPLMLRDTWKVNLKWAKKISSSNVTFESIYLAQNIVDFRIFDMMMLSMEFSGNHLRAFERWDNNFLIWASSKIKIKIFISQNGNWDCKMTNEMKESARNADKKQSSVTSSPTFFLINIPCDLSASYFWNEKKKGFNYFSTFIALYISQFHHKNAFRRRFSFKFFPPSICTKST